MARHPTDLIRVLARHYQLLSAMCRDNRRFASDEELEVFCASFLAPGSSPAMIAARLREVAAVTQATGDWAPPAYLRAFLAEIEQRHALASPGVVRGWVEKLSGLAARLDECLSAPAGPGQGEAAAAVELLEEITDTLASIAGTVSGNCDRIGTEVSRYRAEEDVIQMRSRLGRLIGLHSGYLEPVLALVDIGGEFHEVCEQIASACARVGADAVSTDDLTLRQAATTTGRDVTWLRRGTVRRAQEATRELGPLCEAAARESAISRGVNRALEAIAGGRWEQLDLTHKLQVVIDRDGPLFADRSAAAFVAQARQYREEPPPLLGAETTPTLDVPWSAASLLEELGDAGEVGDVLEWICDHTGREVVDAPAGLLHDLLELAPEGFAAGEEPRLYSFAALDVDACVWSWRAAAHD